MNQYIDLSERLQMLRQQLNNSNAPSLSEKYLDKVNIFVHFLIVCGSYIIKLFSSLIIYVFFPMIGG